MDAAMQGAIAVHMRVFDVEHDIRRAIRGAQVDRIADQRLRPGAWWFKRQKAQGTVPDGNPDRRTDDRP